MKNLFLCPHCQAVLNPNVKILLVVRYRKKQGMILLSPQPGNYNIIWDNNVLEGVKEGSTLTFCCPVCGDELTSPADKKFAFLHLERPGQDLKRVEFCRIYGKHATFIVDGENVTSYGDDVDHFDNTNFFGA